MSLFKSSNASSLSSTEPPTSNQMEINQVNLEAVDAVMNVEVAEVFSMSSQIDTSSHLEAGDTINSFEEVEDMPPSTQIDTNRRHLEAGDAIKSYEEVEEELPSSTQMDIDQIGLETVEAFANNEVDEILPLSSQMEVNGEINNSEQAEDLQSAVCPKDNIQVNTVEAFDKVKNLKTAENLPSPSQVDINQIHLKAIRSIKRNVSTTSVRDYILNHHHIDIMNHLDDFRRQTRLNAVFDNGTLKTKATSSKKNARKSKPSDNKKNEKIGVQKATQNEKNPEIKLRKKPEKTTSVTSTKEPAKKIITKAEKIVKRKVTEKKPVLALKTKQGEKRKSSEELPIITRKSLGLKVVKKVKQENNDDEITVLGLSM